MQILEYIFQFFFLQPMCYKYILLFSSDYAFALMRSLKDQYVASPSALRAISASLAAAAPAPVAKTFQQVDKEEAVTQYLASRSRFSSVHQDH